MWLLPYKYVARLLRRLLGDTKRFIWYLLDDWCGNAKLEIGVF